MSRKMLRQFLNAHLRLIKNSKVKKTINFIVVKLVTLNI